MSLLDELPHRCVIFRQTRKTDSVGGSVYDVVVDKSNVECWEQKASTSSMQLFEKRGITANTSLFFVEDPGVTEQHRILITNRNGVPAINPDYSDVGNPDILDVMAPAAPDASAGLGILFRVECVGKTADTE